MLNNLKIGSKILIIMLMTALGALLVISLISYTEMLNLTKYSESANIQLGVTAAGQSAEALLNQAEEYLQKIASEQAKANNATLKQVQTEVLVARDYLEKVIKDQDNFTGYLPPRPDQTPSGLPTAKGFLAGGGTMDAATEHEYRVISNAVYAFAPMFANDNVLHNIYLGTESGISYRYSKSNKYNPDYDPRERAWYTEAMAHVGEAIWIDTYFDSYGQICVTCCTAFRDKKGKPIGVVATDVTMDAMSKSILATRIGKEGYAFLLDSDGQYIAHPNFLDESFEKDPKVGASEDWLALLEKMKEHEVGTGLVTLDGIQSYISYAPLEQTGWTLCVTVPVDEVTAPAQATKTQIDSYTEEARAYIEATLAQVLNRFIALFAVCTLIFVFFSFLLSGTITKPLNDLVTNVKMIGAGNLDATIVVKGKDEISDLGAAFNNMTSELKEYMENLTKVTAEKERIGTELSVATEIQASMLPNVFPENDEFELYASMNPAKEVGGDFYDFFMIDDRHLAMVMADVSGKGVPAALFMVISKSYIKNRSIMGGKPSEILAFVNDQLCENNAAEMFVTTWLGIMDLDTGIVTATSAGHEFPCIRQPGGKFELLKDPHGFVLAGMEGMRYKDYEFTIEKGGSLFIYTDGVPEATNAENELFGNDRMLEALNTDPDASAKEVLENVRAGVDAFVKDAPQFDDLTMLCMKRRA
ncbi:MAG: HAMP domain-containing protein [Lachnospiraceae bacterium]|nr:HAMP domain-containing protein [Lachnospiraceae bacterium]